MKYGIIALGLIAIMACDDGGTDGQTIIVTAPPDAEGPATDTGPSPDRGRAEADAGGAADDPDAGAGGVGGQGEGGVGGQGEGGVGGQGEGGVGGQGEGGAGGEGGIVCEPDCAGRSCGPDGCGGTCGRGCGRDERCDDGACVREGCADGTFDCGGDCVDLLNDPQHCGSCGAGCAAEWPREWAAQGFTFESANIEAVCARAECGFLCAEAPEVGPAELIDDANNCGACGNQCAGRAANSVEDLCVNTQCACVLQVIDRGFEERHLGQTCDAWCNLSGRNCDDGCCPVLERQARGEAMEREHMHHYLFENDAFQEVDLQLDFAGECPGIHVTLYRYRDGGPTERVRHLEGGCRLVHPWLPPGRYGLTVTAWEGTNPYDLQLRRAPREPLFDAPGNAAAQAEGSAVGLTFRANERRNYTVRFTDGENSSCSGDIEIVLVDDANTVLARRIEEDCFGRTFFEYSGVLDPGLYHFWAASTTRWDAGRRLSGNWEVLVMQFGLPDPEPDPDPDPLPDNFIAERGVYERAGFGAGESHVSLVVLPAGAYDLSTAGPAGGPCPGDTVLSIRRPEAEEVVRNDDALGGVCSQVRLVVGEGEIYEAWVNGFGDRAIGPFSIVVQ